MVDKPYSQTSRAQYICTFFQFGAYFVDGILAAIIGGDLECGDYMGHPYSGLGVLAGVVGDISLYLDD